MIAGSQSGNQMMKSLKFERLRPSPFGPFHHGDRIVPSSARWHAHRKLNLDKIVHVLDKPGGKSGEYVIFLNDIPTGWICNYRTKKYEKWM